MRIYLQPPQPSRGLQRIADALVRYKPEWVEVVPTQAEAELVIIYAIGRKERVANLTDYLIETGRKYAVIQVCLRSTMNPSTAAWMLIWMKAQCVWSYYDLNTAICDDVGAKAKYPSLDNFYHAPLGADASVFYPREIEMGRDFVVMTSGLSRLSESVRECHLAAKEAGRLSCHLGPEVDTNAYMSISGVDDNFLAWKYSDCEFVSGLRRKEGFELPAIEGLLCGARPLVFDNTDWRFNYGNHAIYLQETDRQGVIDQLVEIFKHGAPPVTPEERELAVARYDWKTIIGGFYERLQ